MDPLHHTTNTTNRGFHNFQNSKIENEKSKIEKIKTVFAKTQQLQRGTLGDGPTP
jgi:hypothetical protein